MESDDLFIEVTFIIVNERREDKPDTLMLRILHFPPKCLQSDIGILNIITGT